MTFYTDMQAIASSLLTEFDQGSIVITTVTPAAGPAHNPGSPTEVDTAVKGTVRGVSQKYIDGSLIVAGDFQLTIPGGGVVPTTTSKVKLSGVKHEVVAVIPKPAQGTVAAYTVIFRK